MFPTPDSRRQPAKADGCSSVVGPGANLSSGGGRKPSPPLKNRGDTFAWRVPPRRTPRRGKCQTSDRGLPMGLPHHRPIVFNPFKEEGFGGFKYTLKSAQLKSRWRSHLGRRNAKRQKCSDWEWKSMVSTAMPI
ncbi:hypothetical protein RRG08_003300 [Elysia crispata]|uniref:Uncharacterized protein n=1 Tax=Elysia crispata TaxID=231223 RepID=A0AAE0ZSB5_9GAST|nr:hypothetical protein RRG08_003300 [Elysia crispata]